MTTPPQSLSELQPVFSAQRLYELLPALDRIRDQESGRALEALFEVLAEPVAALEEDLAQLYDDQFIETCAEWAVPYIADLIGYRTLRGASATVRSPRAEVADTIGLRRRKGTAAMLEQLAHDVTGWNARVVEFFQLLGWTQHMRHLRLDLRSFASLRSGLDLAEIGGPFDPVPRTADVRRIAGGRGRYNIPDVGVFLWRLDAYGVTGAPATPVTGDSRRFRFSPLGNDTQLVNLPQTEIAFTHLAEPVNVPGALERGELAAHLGDYWGRALAVFADGIAVPASRVQVCNLDDDPDGSGAWAHLPADNVAVDPVLGRLAFPANAPAPGDVRVTYQYAFSAPMGGGEYGREESFDPAIPQDAPPVGVPDDAATIVDALAALGGSDGVIEVRANDPLPFTGITLAAGQRVELRAHDERRPVLVLAGDTTIDGGADAELILNGFLVTGGGLRLAGELPQMTIRHCTLVPGLRLDEHGDPGQPGAASVVVAPDPSVLLVTLDIDESISGPLRLPADVCELTVTDSILDAGAQPRASRSRVLLSGNLTPFPVLSSPAPRLQVTIGVDGPHEIVLAGAPPALPAAAAALQAAIRAAAPGPAFTMAAVSVVARRLAVLAGTGERVMIEAAGGDLSAAELQLDPSAARQTAGLLSAPLPDPPALQAAAPEFTLRIGAQEAAITGLAANPASLSALRVDMQTRIRACGSGAAFAAALVALSGGSLLVIPGTEEALIAATTTGSDLTTVADLSLDLRPAIGSGPSGAEPGATVTVERSTVIGPVFAKEIPLASDAIFTDLVWTLRRQVGCVRFCYLPPASQTPRQHRCQPADPRDAGRIRPTFTTLNYGEAGYAQLGTVVPAEIAAGADDGAELGAFHDLYQYQRVANLRLRLDEYLRFGLEAGVLFAS
jgi:hypothetical protein